MKALSVKSLLFISFIAVVGFAVLGTGLLSFHSDDLLRAACYLVFALVASSLKVTLPGVTGTMSVIFLFILLGNVELSLGENLAIACSATIFQCFWHARSRPKAVHIIFNVASMASAVGTSYYTYRFLSSHLSFYRGISLALVASACIFFLANTIPVAIVISLTELKRFRTVWSECYFWSFPYYLIGAVIAGLLSSTNRWLGWTTTLLVLPVIYWIYRSYHLYLGRLEDEKKHVEDMAALHVRTIEALALAIEAKDHTTHEHLHRVRTYALELGEALGLSESDMEALRAAALLHDIGKLAVPEHIISKPGRLTPEEFEKMRIHPAVGAEILERVKFPYPVVPIVRAHHEKWDGSGYPDGLKGEDIPIGARILAVVDCLDALASDRQYRPALPLDEAMHTVEMQSGKDYDPAVVAVLREKYADLEKKASEHAIEPKKLSPQVCRNNDSAPSAGFEPAQASRSMDFLSSIAAARQEVQTLYELTHDLGASLSLDETLSVVCVRLKKLVLYDAIAVYVLKDGVLVPEHVNGDNFRLFASLRIPLGDGLSGWVAQNRKPIVNGNPSAESGDLNDSSRHSALRSALSIPLEGLDGVIGVLTLYHGEKDWFTSDHVRILLAISSKIALSVENALKYRIAESSATTDYLTGLPNARSLFLQLDRELARCKRMNGSLTVLVCDLNGFKQVNDRYGHLEGNKVLRIFASKLKENCREYDYVARMGGDEFVVVIPGISPPSVEEMTARMRVFAIESGREVCGTDLLSLSIGRASFPEDGTDAEQLLAKADKQMYLAKQIHHARPQISGRISTNTVPSMIN